MYTSQALVEARIGRALTADEITLLNNALIPGITEYVNAEAGTEFADPGSEQTVTIARPVNGNGTDTLLLPQFGVITAVAHLERDGTTDPLGVTEYYSPKPGVVMRYEGVFKEGKRNYSVTGYKPVLPYQMQFIITAVAGNMITDQANASSSNSSTAEIQSEKIGDYQITYKSSGSTQTIANTGYISPALDDYLSKYKPLRLA